jgi:hypothetical protein
MIPDPVMASLASSLATFVANVVAAEISKQKGVRDDVGRLKKNCDRIAIMIKSAEQKATLMHDDFAKYWLKRVKDHMYDVENIIDLWAFRMDKRRQHDAECQLVPVRACIYRSTFSI